MTNTDAESLVPTDAALDADTPTAAESYDCAYYEAYGPRDESGQLLSPPYRRGEPHWQQFFGTMADTIVAQLGPQTTLDAGCAIGFLVEELRSRGVDAYGVDVSQWAIDQVPDELREYCRVGRLTDEFDRDYDLITCIEVLEHIPGHEAEAAVANLCRHTDVILFSSSPDDFEEPTHVNVQASDYWIGLFAAQGFFRNISHDATYVSPHAVLLERRSWTIVDVAKAYERGWWQAHRTAQGARASRDRLLGIVNVITPQLEGVKAESERLSNELVGASSYVDGVNAERDRLTSELVVARAIFESELAAAVVAGETATRELEALRRTKVFRYTSNLRRIYGKMRRLVDPILRR